MHRHHLHIVVIATAVDVLVLDAQIGKMDLLVEIRQLV
jgi:hypothetical protein